MRIVILVLTAALFLPTSFTQADEPALSWEAAGVLEASRTFVVQAQIAGLLVGSEVKIGDHVHKGDVLAKIDPREYGLALKAAQADTMIAEAEVEAAQVMLQNAESLRAKGVISPQEFTLKKLAFSVAKAKLDRTKVDLERAELNLSSTQITAPFDGTIQRIEATEGDFVTAKQAQIVTIVSIDPVLISFNLPEAIVLKLRRKGLDDPEKLKLAIGFIDEEGYPHEIELDGIEPSINSQTGSSRFRGVMPNPEGIYLPGMSVRIRLSVAGD